VQGVLAATVHYLVHAARCPCPAGIGVSSAASELEGAYAFGWAQNIWADTLA